MTLDPILYSSPAIQIHVAAAMAAIVLTVLIFTRARGTRAHRWLGWSWVAAMAVVALSSFWIYSIAHIGPFSVIHLISAGVVVGLVAGVRAARGRRIRDHRAIMTNMVWGGLVVAGGFTLLPGRIMHSVLFGG